MHVTITQHQLTEAEALDEIAARGWHGFVTDVNTVDEELHWHDFDTVVYLLEGSAHAAFEDGTTTDARAGDRVELASRVVHRDVAGYSYRAVFGLSVDLAELTQPLNKPVELLGDRA